VAADIQDADVEFNAVKFNGQTPEKYARRMIRHLLHVVVRQQRRAQEKCGAIEKHIEFNVHEGDRPATRYWVDPHCTMRRVRMLQTLRVIRKQVIKNMLQAHAKGLADQLREHGVYLPVAVADAYVSHAISECALLFVLKARRSDQFKWRSTPPSDIAFRLWPLPFHPRCELYEREGLYECI
jgi:hypothetical protein